MDIDKITVPTLILNREIAVSNINRMVEKCTATGIRPRPHFKTHQSVIVGEWFRDAGVSSIAVSSTAMASYFADAGWKDITIAFPYNPREHARLEELSKRATINLTIPSIDSARILTGKARSEFNIMIKIDTGYNRAGLLWSETSLVNEIIDIISTNGYLKISGLLTHAGNTYKAERPEDVIQIYNESAGRLASLRNRLSRKELILSVGDTPSASLVNDFGEVDELRPGNFVFNDLMQFSAGVCSLDDIAVAMACPVVDSRPWNGTVVIYGGAVHLSKEYITRKGVNIYGLAVKLDNNGWTFFDRPLYVTSLSQEHGIINIPDNCSERFRPGDIVGVLPVHSCLTANLAGGYLITDGTFADHMNKKTEIP